MLDKLKRIRPFLGEVRAELKKVTFPSRKEVISTTIVVVIASFIFAFYLWLADTAILKAYEAIHGLLGS